MVNVAVAGGTGKVGKTIVEVLKENSKHSVFVLTRKQPDIIDPKVNQIVIDYADINSMTKILKSSNIHTVISCLSVLDEQAGTAEINLIKGSAESDATKRFIASDWGARWPSDAVAYMPHLKYRQEAMDLLRTTNLEWTRYHNRYFLDYYGVPYIESHLMPTAFAIDMQNKMASIPGTGNEPVAFTYTFDLAKFVSASLDLVKWEEETIVIGDKITFNEFVSLAEEARGSKFAVVYDDMAKLSTYQVSELQSHVHVYPFFPKDRLQYMLAVFGRWVVEGFFDLPEDKSLNQKFPEIKTMTAAQLVDMAWKGR